MLGAAADRQVYQLVTYTLEGDLTTIELQLKAAELHYWSANLLTEIKKECLQLHCTLTAKWRTEEKKRRGKTISSPPQMEEAGSRASREMNM